MLAIRVLTTWARLQSLICAGSAGSVHLGQKTFAGACPPHTPDFSSSFVLPGLRIRAEPPALLPAEADVAAEEGVGGAHGVPGAAGGPTVGAADARARWENEV